MSAEKSLLTLDYVHLKGKQYSREHGKRFCKRTLGDVEKRHQVVPPKSSHKLFSTMMSLEFDETRAVNDMTAQHIIHNQSAQIKNAYSNKFRSCQLDEWQSAPVKRSQMNKKSSSKHKNNNARPKTAGLMNTVNLAMAPSVSVRPFSTGPRIRTAPKKPVSKEYMRVENKKMGGFRDIDIHKVANELRESWANEDKSSDLKTPRKRVKSLELPRYDVFSGQWLSFAGGSSKEGGVVDAFLGKDVDEYYNIEGQVGSVVVNQVSNGNRVNVCINGELQSDDMKVRKWKSAESKEKHTPQKPDVSTANNTTSEAKPLEGRIPLSWEDQVNQPSVKILEPSVPQPAATKIDMTERYPVVFQKLSSDDKPRTDLIKPNSYHVRSSTKNRRNINGIESLNKHITVITVDQRDDDDADSLASEDYHEILQKRLEAGEKPQEDYKEEPEEEIFNVKNEPKKKPSKEIIRTKSSMSHQSLTREGIVPVSSSMFSTSPSLVNLVAQGSNPNIQSRPPSSVISSKLLRGGSSKCSSVQEERHINSATQRPQLAKPGHLPRTGSGLKEREKEFVSISQQIRLPSGVSQKSLGVSPDRQLSSEKHHDSSEDEMDASIGKLSCGNSMESLDSLIANENNEALDHDYHNCTCTLEAKLAVSAALSGTSHQATPSTIINVNLPTVQMSTSDLMSDTDPCPSVVSFRGDLSRHNTIEEYTEELGAENDSVTASNNECCAHSNTEPGEQHKIDDPEIDMIINQVDGLSMTPDNFQIEQETLVKRPKSVKFQDEVVENTPVAPTNSPRGLDQEEDADFGLR